MSDIEHGGAAESAESEAAQPRRFVVVGGGVGGLVVARDLARSGAEVVLLEASDHLGGQVHRHLVGGIELDAGAEAFATRNTAVADLATELGLADAIVAPQPAPAWLYSANGMARPLPATSVLGIPGSPLASDVVATIGFGAAVRAYLETLLPGPFGAKSTTLGQLVRRRMGRRVLERLVAPITMGVHSAHPDQLPLDRVAPGLRIALLREGSLARGVRSLRERATAGSAVGGIRGGLARLVDELIADLEHFGVEVRLNTPVTSVEPAHVIAGGERVEGTVIVAAPGVLEPATTTPAVLVTLVVESAELGAAPRGSGILVAAGAPGVRARALTHQSAKWSWLADRAGGRHVLRLSYADEPADAVETARGDAATLLGVTLSPEQVVDSAIVHWHRASVAASTPEGVHRVGETAAGGGLASVVAQARAVAAELISVPQVSAPEVKAPEAED